MLQKIISILLVLSMSSASLTVSSKSIVSVNNTESIEIVNDAGFTGGRSNDLNVNTETSGFAGGDGSLENPYKVSTPEQLNAVRNNLNANYIQINDIDLSMYENWIPIGYDTSGTIYGPSDDIPCFSGTYDGNNYSISNLTINESKISTVPNLEYYGLFSFLSGDCTIENVNLQNVKIDIDKSLTNYEQISSEYGYCFLPVVGGLAGRADECNVLNCVVSGKISLSAGTEVDLSVGGIIGYGIGIIVTSCINSADIEVTGGSYNVCGGIIGSSSGEMQNCQNKGSITVISEKRLECGGIIGNSRSSISHCVNFGKICGTVQNSNYGTFPGCYVGGIAGLSLNSMSDQVEYCLNYGDICSADSSDGLDYYKDAAIQSYAGGIAGYSITYFDNNVRRGSELHNNLNLCNEINSYKESPDNDGTMIESDAGRIAGFLPSDSNNTDCYSVFYTSVNGKTPKDNLLTSQKNGATLSVSEINELILKWDIPGSQLLQEKEEISGLKFDQNANLYIFIGDSQLYDIENEFALLTGEFRAKFDENILLAEDIAWASSDESVFKITNTDITNNTIYLSVEGISAGTATLTATIPSGESLSSIVHVVKPNQVSVNIVHENEYYYENGVLFGESVDFTDTPEFFVSIESILKNEICDPISNDANTLHNITISASIDDTAFSFSKDSYVDTYSQSIQDISLNNSRSDLILLYPYNYDANSESMTSCITIRISGDDFDTIEKTFKFTVKSFSNFVDQHIRFATTDPTYLGFKRADFAGQMYEYRNTAAYKWEYYTRKFGEEVLNIENPYEIMMADIIADLAQSDMLDSLKIKVLSNEWKSLYNTLLDGLDTIFKDDYTNYLYQSKNKIDKLLKVSKYTNDVSSVDDELFETIIDILGSKKNTPKIQSLFTFLDKAGQGFEFVNTGIKTINEIRDGINFTTALNAYIGLDEEYKQVFESIAKEVGQSNAKLYNAIMRYANSTVDANSYRDALLSISGGTLYRSAYAFLSSTYSSAVKSMVWNYIGSWPVTVAGEVVPLEFTALGHGIFASLGAIQTGIGLGLGISDFLCDASSVADQTRKFVVAGELSQYVNTLLADYEASLIQNRTNTSAREFEAAFCVYKAVQKYSMASTKKALELQSDAFIIKLFSTKDYAGAIADISSLMTTLDALSCHSEASNTVSVWTKVVQVKCPVDVFLYDAGGQKLISIENNETTYRNSDILVDIIGDEKYISLPATQDYHIQIVATGSGTMDYSVIEMNGFDEAQRVNFYNVPLQYNQSFIGTVVVEKMAEADMYALTTTESSGDERTIYPSETISGSTEISITVSAIGHGTVSDSIVMSKGDNATVVATADEGEKFLGWYIDNTVVSQEAEYRFCAIEDVNIVGYFTTEVLEHTHELDYYPSVAATCVREGNVAYYHCSICGKNFSDEGGKNEVVENVIPIDPENHTGNTELKDEKDATCTEDGFTGDLYCADCGEKLEGGKAVEALGHDIQKVEAKDPTHTTQGCIEHYVCSRCGKVFADEKGEKGLNTEDVSIPKIPHEFREEWMYDEENHWHECACSEKDAIAAHNFGDWTVTKEATTDAKGERIRTCSACGYKEKQGIEKLTDSAKTGDNMMLGIDLVLLIISGLSLASMAFLPAKKWRKR